MAYIFISYDVQACFCKQKWHYKTPGVWYGFLILFAAFIEMEISCQLKKQVSLVVKGNRLVNLRLSDRSDKAQQV